MKILQKRLLLSAVAVTGMLLLQGCGQNAAVESEGESFAAAAEGDVQLLEVKSETPTPPKEPVSENTEASAEISASPSPVNSPEVSPVATLEAVQSPGTVTGKRKDKAAATEQPSPASKHSKTAAPTVSGSVSTSTDSGVEEKGSKKESIEGTGALQSPAVRLKPSPSPLQSALDKAGGESVSSTDKTSINWDGFFDGTDQTRPSERFWDLSGSQVTIKGFMGEVLSFEKNWFLLIPEPGAECPFDNGDETYWNKIMIVFVPEGSKLRYTSDPLEITGRLDVGIKIDESGYKTMFRLYDASFTSIK